MRRIKRSELLTPEVVAAAQQHARDCYPAESIGCVSGGRYIAFENVADDKKNFADPEPELYRQLMSERAIDCLIHSHTNGKFYPTEQDMIAQINHGIPCGVLLCIDGKACTHIALWGDALEPQPLEGRLFQHGIADCYEAVRDWYWVNHSYGGLPPVPRSWEWWRNGRDLFLEHIDLTDFETVKSSEIKKGDAILFKIPTRSLTNKRLCVGETYNHAAIYLGNDTIYHHPSSADGYDPVNKSGFTGLSNRLHAKPMCLRLRGI